MIIRKRKSRRSQIGTAAIELATGMILIVPLVLLGVNVCTLGLASFFNDQASKEAAREASEQTSLVPARQVAEAVVRSYAIANGAISSPQIAGVEFEYSDDSHGEPIELGDLNQQRVDADRLPTVTVTTRLAIQTPAPVIFQNRKFTDRIILQSQHTYPILSGIDPDPNSPGGSGDDRPVDTDPSDGQNGDAGP